MGYVDAETMIEFKNKMVEKYKKSNHVLCRLNPKIQNNEWNTPLFQRSIPFEKDALYTYAVGQIGQNRGHYLHPRNGNGYYCTTNDYQHIRKKYIHSQVDTSHNFYTFQDLFNLLFSHAVALWGPEHSEFNRLLKFPGYDKDCINYQIMLVGQGTYNDFIDMLFDEEPFLIEYFLNRRSNTFTTFRGKLFIVKNEYLRGSAENSWFCEDVYSYLHLLISVNDGGDDGFGHNTIYINITNIKN